MKTHTHSKQNLIRKYHTLASKVGLSSDEKNNMLVSNFGIESSTKLNVMQLQDLCNELEKLAYPKLAELDKLRKRLIASIFGWLKAMNKEGNMKYVKAIACRAAGKQQGEFNKIPVDRLRSLYNSFSKQTKDLYTTGKITSDELSFLAISN